MSLFSSIRRLGPAAALLGFAGMLGLTAVVAGADLVWQVRIGLLAFAFLLALPGLLTFARAAIARWRLLLGLLKSIEQSTDSMAVQMAQDRARNKAAVAQIPLAKQPASHLEPSAQRATASTVAATAALAKRLLDLPATPSPAPMAFTAESATITVVLTCCEDGGSVAAAVNALRQQTHKDFQAIIIDDSSTDESEQLIRAAAKGDARFTFAIHQKKSGRAAACNTGLRLATTEIICFVSASSILPPNALENALRDARNGMTAAHAGLLVFARRDVATPVFASVQPGFLTGSFLQLGRTALLRAAGGFEERNSLSDSLETLWLRLMCNGHALKAVAWDGKVNGANEPATDFAALCRWLADQRLSSAGQIARLLGLRGLAELALHSAEASPDGARLQSVAEAAGKAHPAEAGQLFALVLETAGFDPAIAQQREAAWRLASLFTSDHDHGSIQATPLAREAVFIVQNNRQARVAAALSSRLTERGFRLRILSTETVSGDQGAERFLAAEQTPFTPYGQAVLQAASSFAVLTIVMRPCDLAGIDLARLHGAVLVEAASEDAPISDQDDGPLLKADETVDITALEQRVAAAFAEGAPAPAAKGAVTSPAVQGTTAPLRLDREEIIGVRPDIDRIATMHNAYRGKRCFIIGNGPSLNQTDLTKLKNEFTFAVNGIFYKRDEMGFDPTFYVVEDSSVMKENIEAIRAYKGIHKLFPTNYKSLHPPGDNVYFFRMNRGFYEKTGDAFCIPKFSTDASRRVYCGQSVTHINLQLAYYFGFSEVYLIGMDFSYVIPPSAIVKGDLITSTEADPNHFNSLYFGPGKTWKDPKLHRVQQNYEIARDIYAADGRKIINATKGGKLEVFERADYDALFR